MENKEKKCLCDKSYGDLCGCEKINAKKGDAVTKPLLDLTIIPPSGCVKAKLMNTEEMQKLINDNDMGDS